ncbi:hypothetical protein MASR2M78_13270 [Treponema sp.]
MGLLDSIGDFFTLFFSKDPAGAKERRALRDLHSYLKNTKPPVYRAKGNLILPAFASSVYDLAVALRPMREVFGKTLLAQDLRIVRRFHDFLIETRFGQGEQRLLASCSYAALLERSASSSDASALVSVAEADFALVLKYLDSSAMRDCDKDLAELERLVDLCRYDYTRLLSAFDSNINIDSLNYKPKFQAVEGTSLGPELLDFYTIVADLRLGNKIVADIALLAERLGGEHAANLQKILPKAASQVNKSLSGVLATHTLSCLIRAVSSQSNFKMPLPEKAPSALDDYKGRLVKHWAEERDRFLREKKESSLGTEILALFGKAPEAGLLDLLGYSSQLNTRLQAEVSRSFTWFMPLRLLKTFHARYVFQGFLDASRRLAIEGFFSNAVLRSRLTDAVAKLEKAQSRIAAFEEAAAGNNRGSATALMNALDELLKGKDTIESIERSILSLDGRAEELVVRDVGSLRELAEAVFDVLSDFKKATPELITNIKTLASSKEKALIPSLVSGYNASVRFLKLMKAFMVLAPMSDTSGEA